MKKDCNVVTNPSWIYALVACWANIISRWYFAQSCSQKATYNRHNVSGGTRSGLCCVPTRVWKKMTPTLKPLYAVSWTNRASIICYGNRFYKQWKHGGCQHQFIVIKHRALNCSHIKLSVIAYAIYSLLQLTYKQATQLHKKITTVRTLINLTVSSYQTKEIKNLHSQPASTNVNTIYTHTHVRHVS